MPILAKLMLSQCCIRSWTFKIGEMNLQLTSLHGVA